MSSTMRVALEMTADNRQAVTAIAGVRQEVEKLGPAAAAAGQAGSAGLTQLGTAAAGAATPLTRAAGGLRETEVAARAAGQAVGVTSNQMRQLAPQLNDIATQLAMGQSPFMILAAQGGQITQIFGGVRNTLAALAGFLGPGGIAAILGVGIGGAIAAGLQRDAVALSDLSQRLRATRADAASLAREVDQAAQNVSQSSGVSRSDARDVGRIIAGQRNFQGDRAEIEGLIRLSADLARVMGVDVTQAAEQFTAKAIRDPAAAAREAAAGGLLGFNDALRRQAELLVAAGDRAGASRLVLDQFGRAAAGAAQDLTPLQQLWERVANAMSSAANAATDLANRALRGMPAPSQGVQDAQGLSTRNTTLEILRQELAARQSALPEGRRDTDPRVVSMQTEIARLETEVASLSARVPTALRSNSVSPELSVITATSTTREVQAAVTAQARLMGVPEDLALAIARRENGLSFNGRNGEVARSPAGALGTMQLMPETAAGLGVDPRNPIENILGGLKFIQQLAANPLFRGDNSLIGAAYNAGPGRVTQYLQGEGRPLAGETLRYAAAMPGGGRLAESGRAVTAADQATQGFDGNADQRRVLNERISTARRGLAPLDPDSDEAKRYSEAITQLQAQLAALDTPLERSARALRDQGAAFRENAGAARDLVQAESQARNTARERGLTGQGADAFVSDEVQRERGRLADTFRQSVVERTREIDVQRAGLAVAQDGAAAVERDTIAQQARNIALRSAIAGTAEYAEQVRTLIPLLTTAASTPRISTLLVDQSQRRASQNLEQDLIGATATERAQRTAQLRAEQRLGIGANTPEGQTAIANERALAANQVELERQQATFQEIGRVGEQAFDRIGSAITSGTLSLKSMGSIGTSVASELVQAFARLAILNPIKNALLGGNSPTLSDAGGLLGRLLGNSTLQTGSATSASTYASVGGGIDGAFGFHGGGIAGGIPTFFRPMNDNLFTDARRYHAGGLIGHDEVPAILQKGEGVFTADQMAAMGPAGHNVTVNMPVNFTGDSGSQADRESLLAVVDQRVRAGVAAALPSTVKAAHAYTLAEVNRGGAAARTLGRR